MNIENLTKLAVYLEGLPSDYDHFGMASFVESNHGFEKLQNYALNNGGVHTCGTAACAAGHGPAAGILVPKKYVTAYSVNWVLYSREKFDLDSAEWEWLFDGGWTDYDDTHQGAAARIRYLLEHKKPPRDQHGNGFAIIDVGGFGEPDHLELYRPYVKDVEGWLAGVE